MERNHNTPVPPANDLRQLFRVHSILTLDELKSALGTQVAMTVFRKLRPLAYLSSLFPPWQVLHAQRDRSLRPVRTAVPPPSPLLPPPHPDQHLCRSGRRLRSRLHRRRTRAPAARPGQGSTAQAGSPGSHPALQGRPPLGPLLGRQQALPCPAARQTQRRVRVDRSVRQLCRAGRARRVARRHHPVLFPARRTPTPSLRRT